MPSGTLNLDILNEDDESHFQADILKCSFEGDLIVLTYEGTDEGRRFGGGCRLQLVNESKYEGAGTFAYHGDQPSKAIVLVEKTLEVGFVFLNGTWDDKGDGHVYDLSAEVIVP